MLNEVRCLIVDDEPLALDVIENYLERLRVREIRRCENPVDAFRLVQEESFDLIFLDIEMPMLTGLDFIKTIKNPPAIIITTAYRDYAVEGFEFEVLDYLVKPISFPRFMQAFERALKSGIVRSNAHEETTGAGSDYLFLKVDRKFVKVNVKEILYIESLKDYIRVTTRSNSWVSYQTLATITSKLPVEGFIRVHRSFTIAVDKVNVIEGNCLEIEGKLIPISREHRQEVFKRIYK
jgi:DNA-binding LytR/AlgR family response regulator